MPEAAFICHHGTFEFTNVPSGVPGSPATFQALIDKALKGIKHSLATAYSPAFLCYGRELRAVWEPIQDA